MAKILPHTERFILIFNKLKAEKKLPSNDVLAREIGLNSGNSLTEIRNRRQNIGLDVLQKFCDKYGPGNGFTYSQLAGTASPFPEDDLDWERAKNIALQRRLAQALSWIYELKGRPRSYEECLEDIDADTHMILADLRRSGKHR